MWGINESRALCQLQFHHWTHGVSAAQVLILIRPSSSCLALHALVFVNRPRRQHLNRFWCVCFSQPWRLNIWLSPINVLEIEQTHHMKLKAAVILILKVAKTFWVCQFVWSLCLIRRQSDFDRLVCFFCLSVFDGFGCIYEMRLSKNILR